MLLDKSPTSGLAYVAQRIPRGQTGFEVQGSHIGNADAPVQNEFERQVASGTRS